MPNEREEPNAHPPENAAQPEGEQPEDAQPEPSDDDILHGERVFAELIPTLDSMAPVPYPAGVDLRQAVLVALGAHGRLDRLGLRPELALLPPRLWSAKSIDDTRDLALALQAATRVAANAGAVASGAKVPAELATEAAEVRGRMFDLLWYHLKNHPVAGPIMVSVASGNGYIDMADDLARMAPLHEIHRKLIENDQVNFRAGDAKRARELSAALTLALAGGVDGPTAALRVWKLFARLEQATNELVRGARFAREGLGFTDAHRHFPNLRGAARRR
jgi:hypothetical protein